MTIVVSILFAFDGALTLRSLSIEKQGLTLFPSFASHVSASNKRQAFGHNLH